MKPPPFTYHRPASVVEAAQLLAELGDAAKVLAGGQSLVPLLNFRLAAPDHLVDINGLDGEGGEGGNGLDRIELHDDAVEVGATVRDARLLGDPLLQAHPLLVEAAGFIAHPVIRNRGTVCGSLAHADPAAELPALLALLDGSVDAVSWRSGRLTSRRIAAADLYAGPLQTTLQPDELVVAATFPRLPEGTGWAVEELARRRGDFALAGVVLVVTVDDDDNPVAGRAAYLSCAPTPVVVDLAPALEGFPPGVHDGSTVSAVPQRARDAVYDLVASSLDPTDDIHADAAYRRHLAATLTARALARALDRARAGADPPRSVTWNVARSRDVPGHRTRGGDHHPGELHEVVLRVNGVVRAARAPARRLLSDLLRHDLGLTGTHVGCEHGVCGACTVLLDGEPVRSCLTFAVTADGADVITVEGLGTPGAQSDGQAGGDVELGPVQQAFRECHGLQCGFCTPGFLLLTTELLERSPTPSDDEITEALGGNLCRCTGYVNIVRSVRRASELVAATSSGPTATDQEDPA